MGLDIYFKKLKKNLVNEEELNENKEESIVKKLNSIREKEYKKRFVNALDAMEKKLCKASESDYDIVYKRELKKLFKFFNYSDYYLRQFGYKKDYPTGVETIKPVSIDVFKKESLKIIDDYYAPYEAYFRKVNFIYAFFEHSGLIDHDTECALFKKSDIEELIHKCQMVLTNRKDLVFVENALPTQSGFFFGSTDYDDWYFNDVKDCMRQMKKFIKNMDSDDYGWVIFSW